MAIDVDQGEAVEARRRGPVEEEAGADTGLEMIGREMVAVEIEQKPRRAAPRKTVGEAVHQHVVDREHDGRVDRLCLGDRGLIRRMLSPWREILGHGADMPPGAPQKKGAGDGAL